MLMATKTAMVKIIIQGQSSLPSAVEFVVTRAEGPLAIAYGDISPVA